MTPEDKQLIADYMGWKSRFAHILFKPTDEIEYTHNGNRINFDSNDASLCLQKMVEKGDWWKFFSMVDDAMDITKSELVKWLFNADNFFMAMASWLRTK